MPTKDKRLLSKLELMVMDIIWENGEATVRQVRNAIAEKRDLAYNTVMTIMRRLKEKGILEYAEQGRTYVYHPLVSREEVKRSMLRDLLQNVFGGSSQELVTALVSHEHMSEKELLDIAKQMEVSVKS